MFSFHYLQNAPIIDVAKHPELNGNANGPALIATPGWLNSLSANYLLYFAHHEGKAIKLATSDHLTGPWQIAGKNPLDLENSHFTATTISHDVLHSEARAYIESGADGYYPHIASPDLWVDNQRQQLRLYYHGRLSNGIQRTRVSISSGGVNFKAKSEILGLPYFRIFKHQQWFYALAMPGQLYRSRDGLSDFEAGPQITDEPMRHHAVLYFQKQWYVFWTRVGDSPERIFESRLITNGNWKDWRLDKTFEVHRPCKSWESSDETLLPSTFGTSMQRVNQLRDPAIFQESDKVYLLYAIVGEQGIGIGELRLTE